MSRILIVEDEWRLSSFLEKGLRANGFTTTTAPDGRTARLLASDDEFELMLLDLGLPDVDGLDLLRELRARGERLPTIVLTARDEVDEKVAGLEGGADDYVTRNRSASRSCSRGCACACARERRRKQRCSRWAGSRSTCARARRG